LRDGIAIFLKDFRDIEGPLKKEERIYIFFKTLPFGGRLKTGLTERYLKVLKFLAIFPIKGGY